jgi:hypothetical protein
MGSALALWTTVADKVSLEFIIESLHFNKSDSYVGFYVLIILWEGAFCPGSRAFNWTFSARPAYPCHLNASIAWRRGRGRGEEGFLSWQWFDRLAENTSEERGTAIESCWLLSLRVEIRQHHAYLNSFKRLSNWRRGGVSTILIDFTFNVRESRRGEYTELTEYRAFSPVVRIGTPPPPNHQAHSLAWERVGGGSRFRRVARHYTVKKSWPFSRPQPGCHWSNSSWAGKI